VTNSNFSWHNNRWKMA